ncbi:MAG: hypothetical protein AAF348_05650 [Bacteroidota bacterium]
MKKIIYSCVIVLTTMILISFSSKNEKTEFDFESGRVMAFRPLTLLETTTPEELEKFGHEQLTPTFNKYVPGVKSYIIKGQRGDNKDKFAHLLIFDNEATRDFYFPYEHSGESNIPEVALKLWRPGQIILLDSLPKYTKSLQETTDYTDYIFIE